MEYYFVNFNKLKKKMWKCFVLLCFSKRKRETNEYYVGIFQQYHYQLITVARFWNMNSLYHTRKTTIMMGHSPKRNKHTKEIIMDNVYKELV